MARAFETTPQWESSENHTVDNGETYPLALIKHPIYLTAMAISTNYLYVLCAFGVTCNILSFLVLRRIKPLTSAILVMTLLSVMDSLALIVICLNTIKESSGIAFTDIYCSVVVPIRYLLQYYPIWLVVLLTLERVVAVCFPLKASWICTLSNARRSIIILFILDVLLCIAHTFIYEELDNYRGNGCYRKAIHLSLYNDLAILDSVFFVVIPLILLCFGNLVIIVKLKTVGEIDAAADDSALNQESRRQNRSITIMLLAVCTTTIVCLLPNILLAYTNLMSPGRSPDSKSDAIKDLILSIIMLLSMCNNAVNFFLYILTGRRFRAVFRDMVCSWCGKTINQ